MESYECHECVSYAVSDSSPPKFRTEYDTKKAVWGFIGRNASERNGVAEKKCGVRGVWWNRALCQTLWAPPLPLASYPVLPVPQRLQYARADDQAALRWAWWRSEEAPADDGTTAADADGDDAARGSLVASTRMYSAHYSYTHTHPTLSVPPAPCEVSGAASRRLLTQRLGGSVHPRGRSETPADPSAPSSCLQYGG